jgi:hypothetical protein
VTGVAGLFLAGVVLSGCQSSRDNVRRDAQVPPTSSNPALAQNQGWNTRPNAQARQGFANQGFRDNQTVPSGMGGGAVVAQNPTGNPALGAAANPSPFANANPAPMGTPNNFPAGGAGTMAPPADPVKAGVNSERSVSANFGSQEPVGVRAPVVEPAARPATFSDPAPTTSRGSWAPYTAPTEAGRPGVPANPAAREEMPPSVPPPPSGSGSGMAPETPASPAAGPALPQQEPAATAGPKAELPIK